MQRSSASIFKELNERLDLPARRRALLLRELRADLDDLAATLVAEGVAPEVARARAMEMLAPTQDDARVLAGLHRPSYARMVEGLRPARVQLVERISIGAMAALAVLAPVRALVHASRLPSPTLMALGCVALLLVANLGWQAFRIVVRDDADARSLARAGAVQGALVGLTLTVGGLAVVAEAYLVADAWSTAGGMVLAEVVAAASRCAETAALTLGLTVLGVFGALALLQWHLAARDVEDELDALVEPVPPFGQE